MNFDLQLFLRVNEFARATPWLHGLAVAYANDGLVVFARVYIAAHYPHDVTTGLVVGAVVSVLGYLAPRPVLAWLLALTEATPLRPLVTNAPTPSAPPPHEG